MQEIVSSFNDLISAIGVWLSINRDSILAGIISTVILGIIGKTIYFLLNKPKEIHELLRTNNFNDLDWIEELDKALEIKDTMKRNFPEYSDYLLIQYGSSVDANSKLPQDYDFIVLMLGFPKEGRRYLHNKGTGGLDDVSSKENKFDVDIVYRDYLSFLYAATAGMPYENSVIVNGRLLKGHKGYFQWLKNITQNHLYDRDFLIRRFEDKIATEKQELSENNLLNQIIKTAVMLLLRNAKVKAEYKDDLKKKMLFFSDVDKLEPTSIRWSSIRFQRNNQTYRMLISICQLIIEGMLITTDAGEYRLASFVDEQRMCRLYEKFILEYYSKHFPELSVSASQIPWSVDDGIRTMLPVMQSDIHLQKGNTVLIIDAKYYSHTTQTQYDKHTLHSNNMYQIFTYVKNRDYEFGDEDHKVSGMLLYAKTDEEIQPDNVYQMHGNQITVRTLDLNKPFSDIAKQLNTIAETHFDLPERSKV